jgi:hypothetical protein
MDSLRFVSHSSSHPTDAVFSVDIDDKALKRLRKRLDEDAIRDVTVIKGATDDPKVPERTLDPEYVLQRRRALPSGALKGQEKGNGA